MLEFRDAGHVYVNLKTKEGLVEDIAAWSDRHELDGLR